MEDQRTRLQSFFKIALAERNCLIVVVGTDNIEVQAFAHTHSISTYTTRRPPLTLGRELLHV